VKKNISRRKNQRGVIITLVAIFMLFVIGAMAALSIDVVTLYTARSEAQLAADAAALAGARVLANSGATSDTSGASMSSAWTLATAVATQVAEQNQVAGVNLTAAQITFPAGAPGGTNTNPTITVKVQITNLPTFFARIWGTTSVMVGASATAEAYNPSGASALGPGATATPVAPMCVKPWLLPNMDPTQQPGTPTPQKIFDAGSGAIVDPGLIGQTWPSTNPGLNTNGLFAVCGDCSVPPFPPPKPGQYYPVAMDNPTPAFPTPTQALPACSAGFNSYQLGVAGCVQQTISCGANSAINPSTINIDPNPYVAMSGSRDGDTVQAAGCLIHYNLLGGVPGDSDSIDSAAGPGPSYVPPFQFLGGNQNPVAGAVNQTVLVSDSLVTIPVIDATAFINPINPVTVIGFLQVFLNPQSTGYLPALPPAGTNQIQATVINMAGCGTSATGQPILGNGPSPVAVRLISP